MKIAPRYGSGDHNLLEKKSLSRMRGQGHYQVIGAISLLYKLMESMNKTSCITPILTTENAEVRSRWYQDLEFLSNMPRMLISKRVG